MSDSPSSLTLIKLYAWYLFIGTVLMGSLTIFTYLSIAITQSQPFTSILTWLILISTIYIIFPPSQGKQILIDLIAWYLILPSLLVGVLWMITGILPLPHPTRLLLYGAINYISLLLPLYLVLKPNPNTHKPPSKA